MDSEKYNQDTKDTQKLMPAVSNPLGVKVLQLMVHGAVSKDRGIADRARVCTGCKDWACSFHPKLPDEDIMLDRGEDCTKSLREIKGFIILSSELHDYTQGLIDEYGVTQEDLDQAQSEHPVPKRDCHKWAKGAKDYGFEFMVPEGSAPKLPHEWDTAYKALASDKFISGVTDLTSDEFPEGRLSRLYAGLARPQGGKKYCSECGGFVCYFPSDAPSEMEIMGTRMDLCKKTCGEVKKCLKPMAFIKQDIAEMETKHPDLKQKAVEKFKTEGESRRPEVESMQMLLDMLRSMGAGQMSKDDDPEGN